MFWIPKKRQRTVDPDIEKMKRKTHDSAAKADKNIKKLNDLLEANGITLKIYIATGGHHGH